ncbi:hypothetical protein AMATHDRAFT_63188 [Amanita thiersii Skay4041]|uniref:Uncharacterized protein n=1 Tax=Amanita thiersii Skay4041 TaxID=703135 RepID=A0A2A9NNW3_9AGAR|nr:hypothetical protein AMATHDRAFT_63188 [Amanita thiersii Skay4041]
MAIFYPDNNARGNRVEQLANDIQHLQEQTRQMVKEATEHDKKAVAYLNEILAARSKDTLDDFIVKIENVMDKEHLNELKNLKDAVGNLDDSINIALKVGGGIAALGVTLKLGAPALRMFIQRQFLFVGIRSLVVGVMKLIAGEFNAGMKLILASSKMFSKFFRGGKPLVGRAATAFKVMKVLGKVLLVAGIVIDAVTFGIDLHSEGKQRDALQAAIKELSVSRFQAKELQMQASITVSYSSDARATLDTSATLYGLVKDGTLTKDLVDKKVKDKLDAWISKGTIIDGVKQPSLDEKLKGVTDEVVYANLFKFDKDRDAWMYEDPNLAYIKSEIEKKAAEEEKKREEEEKKEGK